MADEVEGEPVASEAEAAVTDLDRPPLTGDLARAPTPVQPEIEPERIERTRAESPQPVTTETEAAEKSHRRSTVREKVSFAGDFGAPAASTGSGPARPTEHSAAQPEEPVGSSDSGNEGVPRRAGWWSRRFGGGE